ncbi:MAG: copper oxidase, partial [Candidatus Nitrosotenuis sp.]|nr:copper oxidase [Candidatus Nitrosotenuis sp.]
MIFVLVVTAILTTFYFAYPNSSNAKTEEKTFLSHNGAVIKTTGEVIDPLYTVST